MTSGKPKTPFSPTPGSRLEPAKGRGAGWVILPVLIFAVIVGAFTYALNTADPSRLPSTLIGRSVPAVTFDALADITSASGKPLQGVAPADFARGDVTVVNFWASWCQPCIAEVPLLHELKKTAGVRILGVNYKDKPEAARRFLAEFGNPFAAVGVDPRGRGSIEWGVYGMPETFVVGADGRIAYKHIGEITAENLRTKLLPAVEAAQAARTSQPAAGAASSASSSSASSSSSPSTVAPVTAEPAVAPAAAN